MAKFLKTINDAKKLIETVPGLLQHSQNTTKIVFELAPYVTKTDPSLLALGTFFHDLGKIKWPGYLHTKKGLTPEDWSIIRSHPELGYSTLFDINSRLPQIIYDVVRYHHERPDGKGYPNSANDISLDIQFVAAIESYEAMTSFRPYRDLIISHDQAIAELEKWCPSPVLDVLGTLKQDGRGRLGRVGSGGVGF